ncbi:MAG: AAA family ATPase, partial [Solirubrobacteraceae bacterium]
MEETSSVARVIAERFHVLSPLGGGGMMLGRDMETGATVTLKPFPAATASESARAAAMRHAAIGALEVSTDGEQVWLIRPYVRGVALTERLDEFTLASCAVLARGLLEALGELHSRGLTHLSVHPGNVLVNPDGPIRSAVLVDSAAALMRPTRSIRFGAPEQTGLLEADTGTSAATDLYAVGLILYEALTGVGPHDGGDVGELLRRRLTDDPAPLRAQRPQIPAGLEREVRRLIALRPEDRPASAAESLEALLGAFNLSAGLSGRDEELESLLRHDRGLLLLTGPAGSGKTRLLEELAARSERWVLRGSAREIPRAPLLALDGPARAIAARAAREPGFSSQVRALGSSASVMLTPLRGEFPPSGRPDSAAVAALIAGLGEPVVLVVDDCEWADQATIDALRALVGAPGVSVIAAACGLPEDHALMHVGEAAHIELGRLDDAAIAAIAPGTELLAQGNPARAAIARDWLRLADGQPELTGDLLARRLELIQPDLMRTLAAAAVLGRRFDPEVLRRLAGAHAPRAMRAAERDGLLEGEAFREGMLHSAILHSLGSDERARLHRLAAAAMRGRTFERADHMLRGGERSVEVVEQARAAGEAARARGALDVAEHYLRAARKQVLDVAPPLALPVVEALATVLAARGRPDLAAEQLEAASRLAHDPAAEARIAAALAQLSAAPDPPEVSRRGRRGRGLIRRGPPGAAAPELRGTAPRAAIQPPARKPAGPAFQLTGV